VEEVYLSLTAGRWDYTRWGETVGDGSPSGGEIFAWLSNFEGDNEEYAMLYSNASSKGKYVNS